MSKEPLPGGGNVEQYVSIGMHCLLYHIHVRLLGNVKQSSSLNWLQFGGSAIHSLPVHLQRENSQVVLSRLNLQF